MKNPWRTSEQDPRPQLLNRGKGPNRWAGVSFLLGVVGALCGLVVPLFLIAWILGILAIVFGAKASKRGRIRSCLAPAGLILGSVAIILGIIGVSLITSDLNNMFENCRPHTSVLSNWGCVPNV